MPSDSVYSSESEDEIAAAAKIITKANPRSQEFKDAAKKLENLQKTAAKKATAERGRKRTSSSKPSSSNSSKKRAMTPPQPPCGDSVPVTKNYAPDEKADSAKDIEFNGYVGHGWFLRISKWEKNKKQYICLRKYEEGSAGKWGANLPLELAENLKRAVDDLHDVYLNAE